MTDPTGIDPRYPSAFQRGGSADLPASPAPPSRPARSTAAPSAPEVDPAALAAGAAPGRLERPPLELIVVGNPWMRALWAVGTLAFTVGLLLAIAAEFGFSAAQASVDSYDPEAFLPPRIAQVLALPFAIAGTVALVAATVLRIVAWRPAAIRELDVD